MCGAEGERQRETDFYFPFSLLSLLGSDLLVCLAILSVSTFSLKFIRGIFMWPELKLSSF